MQKNHVFLSLRRERRTNTFPGAIIIFFLIFICIGPVLANNNSRSSRLASGRNNREENPQQVTVSGTVIDQQGLPLVGVTVVVKGTTLGALTDGSGKYTLTNIRQNATLVFTFIGMATQEIPLNGRTRLDVLMKETSLTLDEVVVIGYGVQKKESVVAAIAQTTSAELQKSGNVTDLTQAITGHLPGVVTVVNAGEPGGVDRGTSATQIYIRGRNTWNGGQALILVDGVERSMDQLDMSEVENISVLKDASATAVFGVKGANGVILITTKRGTSSKPKISFSYNSTAMFLSRLPKWLGSYDAMTARNEAIERELPIREASWSEILPYERVSRYKKPQAPGDENVFVDVNWVDETFTQPSISQRASLNLQGGTGFVNYFGSLSYLHEGDMFKRFPNNKGYDPSYAYDRFNFRSNLDFKLTNTTKLKVNLAGYYGRKNSVWDNEGFSGWDANSWLWTGAYGFDPSLYLPYYPDTKRYGFSPLISQYTMNPAASINNLGVRVNHTMQLNSDFELEQDLKFITKGLKARAAIYYDNSIIAQDGIYDAQNHTRGADGNVPFQFVDPSKYTGPGQPASEYITNYPQTGIGYYDYVIQPWSLRDEIIAGADWIWRMPVDRKMQTQVQLNYENRFGLHNVGAMAMFKREQSAQGSAFPYYREDWIFRTTYDYDTRYLFELNGAYNGSEQFGPGYRFAFFPSVAAGWVVSNEKFFPLEWMNRLKLRYSIGKVGDDKVSGGRWLYADQFSYGGSTRLSSMDNYGSSPYTWYKQSTLGNPYIHWEQAIKSNFGVEIGLFKNLISINYEYFTENRTNILISGSQRNIPPFFGATPAPANLGKVRAWGNEVEVKLDKRWGAGLHLWSDVAITHTKNEIVFRDDPELYYSYQKNAGHAIGQFYSNVRTGGFWENWDDIYASVPRESNDVLKIPGWYNVLDFNGDGIIKSEDNIPAYYTDRPENTYNFSLGGDYKGISLMIQFYGVNNVSRNMSLTTFSGRLNIFPQYSADYYSKDNPDATSHLARWASSGGSTADYWIWDASYLRLKTAELSYTLSDKLLKKTGLSNMRIYLNGNNLLFWSNLPDDREGTSMGNTGAAGGSGTGSASAGAYPTVKRVNFGVEVTF